MTPETSIQTETGCRLDIWLYRTRLIKSRTLASKLIAGGKVRVTRNGKTERVIKPHQILNPGEYVTFMRGQKLLNVEMIAAGARRGPAPEAQSLYRLLTSEDEHAKSRAQA